MQNFFHRMKRGTASIIALTLAFTLYVPTTNAATLNNPTVITDPFIYSGSNTVNLGYTINGLTSNEKADIIVSVLNKFNVQTFSTVSSGKTNGTYSEPWNGRLNGSVNGNDPFEGVHTLKISGKYGSGNDQSLWSPFPDQTKTFYVDVAPQAAIDVTVDNPIYDIATDTNGVNFGYSLSGMGSGNSATLFLTLTDPSNTTVYTGFDTYSDGNYSMTWDGTLNGNPVTKMGTYTMKVSGVYTGTISKIPEKTVTFTVQNSNGPSLTKPTITKNPYNPASGSVDFNFSLQNVASGNGTIMGEIYGKDNDNNPANDPEIFIFQNLNSQSTGAKTFSWTGINNIIKSNTPVPNGSYYMKVWGTAGVVNMIPQTVDFTVDNQVSTPSLTQPTINKNPYNPTTGSVDFTYTLQNAPQNNGTIMASVYVKDNDNNPANDIEIYTWGTMNNQGTGSKTVTWGGLNKNGGSLANGSYYFKVWGTVGNVTLTTQTVDFTVDNQAVTPSLTQPTVSKNPYNPTTGSVDFTYSLLNTPNNNGTINATIYAKDNDNNSANDVIAYTWGTMNNQGTSSKTLTWNGKNSNNVQVANGDYYFKIWGNVGNNTLTAQQVDFKVSTLGIPAITNLKTTPTTFAPSINETTTLSFDLDKNADITISIQNSSGTEIKKYTVAKSAGNNIGYVWEGKDNNNKVVNDGTYKITVKATNTDGSDQKTVDVTVSSAGNCGGFSDVPSDLCAAFAFTKAKGIFLGDDNATTVRPFAAINRSEAAAVMVRAFKKNMLTASGTNEGFSDADTTQSYMTSGTIRTAKYYGIIKGYPDGTLRPAQQVIRNELVVMAVRTSGKTMIIPTIPPYLDTPLQADTSWYTPAVNSAKVWSWIPSDSYFSPKLPMTRADVARLFYAAKNDLP